MNQDNRTISNEVDIQTIVDKTIRKTNVIMDSQVLSTLMSCPCLTDYRFNMNLVSLNGKSNSIECGSIVHKYLEVYFKSLIKGLDRNKAHAFGMMAAEKYIQGDPNDSENYPGLQNTPAESEGYRTGWKFVLDSCEQYFEFRKNEHWVPLEVEIVKSKIIFEDDDIRIMWKSKLDLIVDTNQGIYPCDHKTMKQRREQLNLNNQFTGQALITNSRGVIVNEFGFQKTLKPAEKFTRQIVPYTPDRLIEWSTEIVPYYARMLVMYAESGHWPRNYTACDGKYGRCAFASVCASNPNMREEELKLNFKVGPEWNPTNEGEE